jgi:hypothetical protein
MTCSHHYRVLKSHVSALKTLCVLATHPPPLTLPPFMATTGLLLSPYFAVCRMSQVNLSGISKLSFSLSHLPLRTHMSFQGLVIFHCLDGLQFIYAFSHWRETWSFSSSAVTNRVAGLSIWWTSRRWFLDCVIRVWFTPVRQRFPLKGQGLCVCHRLSREPGTWQALSVYCMANLCNQFRATKMQIFRQSF